MVCSGSAGSLWTGAWVKPSNSCCQRDLADAFDPNKPDWADEYKELQVLLTPEEYKAARASVLNAHYTRAVLVPRIDGSDFRLSGLFRFRRLPLDRRMGKAAQFLLPEGEIPGTAILRIFWRLTSINSTRTSERS